MIVQARWDAGERLATSVSPLSGSQPSALLAAVKNRRPNPTLFIFSAAITPAARIPRPSTVDAMLSSSYPVAFTYANPVMSFSGSFEASTHADATSAKTFREGVSALSTTISRRICNASSIDPSFANEVISFSYVSTKMGVRFSSDNSTAANIAKAVSIPPNPSWVPSFSKPRQSLIQEFAISAGTVYPFETISSIARRAGSAARAPCNRLCM
mmetsp:Transcript_1658/g.3685  ORF Transcript_1658/g.3685 Transcript_1658/m.3685 type:complete len:213 (+) Transcript_1658:1282-1920(+)